MKVDNGGARLSCLHRRIGDFFDVTGRYGDMEGVWIAPVTAQVMMTLRDEAIRPS